MIHYHGLPVTPIEAAIAAVRGGHAFVSFARPEQLGLALEVCQTVAVDNGAFSAWRAGSAVTNWSPYYDWVGHLHRLPQFDFAVIPDVIDGDEDANDRLLDEWPWRTARWRHVGAPVWHLHESLERLERLAANWPRVALGSSGAFASVGSDAWWRRMAEAMEVLCDRDGRPTTRLHGLRMLDTSIFPSFPFSSADSTNIGRNVGIDSRWRGTYTPASKAGRAAVIRERIEVVQPVTYWEPVPAQGDWLAA
jgi:hypothetical protein